MIKRQENTNFSNTISANNGGQLIKCQSPIQLIGNVTFTSTEQRAFFIEGGDTMTRINESSFSSTFPVSLFMQGKNRFITTNNQKPFQISYRKANFMFVGSNASTIEYGIYIVTLADTTTESQTMTTKLFSTTLAGASGELRQSQFDFSSEIATYNGLNFPYILFPYVQNPNGANTITFINYTLF